MSKEVGNRKAEAGNVFVCTACGKMSMDRYGNEAISRGWDVSCVMNCIEVNAGAVQYDEWGRAVRINGEALSES